MDAFDSYLLSKQADDDGGGNGLMMGVAGAGAGAAGYHVYKQHQAQKLITEAPHAPATGLAGVTEKIHGAIQGAHELLPHIAGVAGAVGAAGVAAHAAAPHVNSAYEGIKGAFPAVGHALDPIINHATNAVNTVTNHIQTAHQNFTTAHDNALNPQGPSVVRGVPKGHRNAQGGFDVNPGDLSKMDAEAHATRIANPLPVNPNNNMNPNQIHNAQAGSQWRTAQGGGSSGGMGVAKRTWNGLADIGNMHIGGKAGPATGLRGLLRLGKFASQMPDYIVEECVKAGFNLDHPSDVAFIRDRLCEVKLAFVEQHLAADMTEKAASLQNLEGFLDRSQVILTALDLLGEKAASLTGIPYPIKQALGEELPFPGDDAGAFVPAPPEAHEEYYSSPNRMHQTMATGAGGGLGMTGGWMAANHMIEHSPHGRFAAIAPALPAAGMVLGMLGGNFAAKNA
jgi:hypothetical protein